MNAYVLALLGALVAGMIAIVVVLFRVLRDLGLLTRLDSGPSFVLLQNQIDSLREQVRSSLEGGRHELDRRLEETNRVVGDVRRGLGEVDRQIRSVGDVARDLQGLQELLRSPKIRGGLGEHLLGDLLAQVLPKAYYSLQYEMSGGERVDAVLRVGDGLIPVDAKFPLENFQRVREAQNDPARLRSAQRAFRVDVRRHIDAIAKRYIRPGENGFEFGMMYIPAESVYHEAILLRDSDDGLDLFHYALNHKVIPVSPQSFYAYLQVIVFGLRGLSIEARSREIMARLGDIQSRLGKFTESFDLVGRHLTNAHRQVDEAGRRLARLDAAVSDLSGEHLPTEDGRAEPTVGADH